MKTRVVTQPTEEPIQIIDAKNFVRVDHEEDDYEIQSNIKTVRRYTETQLGRSIADKTYELYLDWFPQEIKLPFPPLISVESITYKDDEGSETTLPQSEYIVDDKAEPAVIIPKGTWPDFTPYPVNAVTVRYKAGYNGDIPEEFITAMKILISHHYNVREPVIVGTSVVKVPFSYESLIANHRLGWF